MVKHNIIHGQDHLKGDSRQVFTNGSLMIMTTYRLTVENLNIFSFQTVNSLHSYLQNHRKNELFTIT